MRKHLFLFLIVVFSLLVSGTLNAQEPVTFSSKPPREGDTVSEKIDIVKNKQITRVFEGKEDENRTEKETIQHKWDLEVLKTEQKKVEKISIHFKTIKRHKKQTVDGNTTEKKYDIPIHTDKPYIVEKKDGNFTVNYQGDASISQDLEEDLSQSLKYKFQSSPIGELLDGKKLTKGDSINGTAKLVRYLLQNNSAFLIDSYLKKKHLDDIVLELKKTETNNGQTKAIFSFSAKLSFDDKKSKKEGDGSFSGSITVDPETCNILSRNLELSLSLAYTRNIKSQRAMKREIETTFKTKHEWNK